jgi:hypothetical protein
MPTPIGPTHPSSPSPSPSDKGSKGAFGNRRVQHPIEGVINQISGGLHALGHLHVRHMQHVHHTLGPQNLLRDIFLVMDVMLNRGTIFPKDLKDLAQQANLPPAELLKKYLPHLIGEGNYKGTLQIIEILAREYQTPVPNIADLVRIFKELSFMPLDTLAQQSLESLFLFLFTQDPKSLEAFLPKLISHFENQLSPSLLNPKLNPNSSETQQLLAALSKINTPAANQIVMQATLFHLAQPNPQNMHQALSFLAHNYTPTSAQAFQNDMAQIIRSLLVNDKQAPLALMESLGYLKMIQDRAQEFLGKFEQKEANAGLRWLLSHIIRAVDLWCKADKRKLHELQNIVAALIYFAHQGEPVARNRLAKLVDWLSDSTIPAERKYGKELSKETDAFTKLK